MSALGVGRQRIGVQTTQGAVDLTAAGGVGALPDQLQVDRQVSALRPAFPLGDQRQPTGQHQRELRAVGGDEQVRQQPRHRHDLFFLGVVGAQQRLFVLGQQVFQRQRAAGLDDHQRRRTGQSAGTQRQHRSRLVGSAAEPLGLPADRVVEAQHFAQPRIQVVEHVGAGTFGQPEERARQLAAAFGVAGSGGRLAVVTGGVPLLAALNHFGLKRLRLGVGGEVVLADEVLTEDQRIRCRHGLIPAPG